MKILKKIIFILITVCSVAYALYFLYENYMKKNEFSSDEEAQKETHKPASATKKPHYTTLNLYQQ